MIFYSTQRLSKMIIFVKLFIVGGSKKAQMSVSMYILLGEKMSYLKELQEHYKEVRKRLQKNAIPKSPPVMPWPLPTPKSGAGASQNASPEPGLVSKENESALVSEALQITSIDNCNTSKVAAHMAEELMNSPRLPPLPGLVLDEPGAIRWMRILHAVAKKHDVSAKEIMSNSRRRTVVTARFEVFYRLRIDLAMSYPKIGRVFRKDHSTILHGVNKVRHKLLDELKRAGKTVSPALVSHPDQSGTLPENLSAA